MSGCSIEPSTGTSAIAINSPGLAATTTLRGQLRCSWQDVTLVSLGTGAPPTIDSLEEVQEYGLAQWGTKLLKLLLEGPNNHVDYLCRRIHGSRYHRVQVGLSFERYEIDDASASNIDSLVSIAQGAYDRVDVVADALLAEDGL